MSVLWGISYGFIKVALDGGVPPAFVAWARVVLAAVVLLVLARRAGTLGHLRGRARWISAYALLEISVPFPLIALGERHVPSSLTAILIASVPLLVAGLALRFDPAERASGRRLLGLVVGLAGVVALVGIDVAGDAAELLGAGAILLAAVGYASGPLVLKRGLGDVDARAAMGASLAVAAVVLAPFAALRPPAAVPSATAVASVVVLGLLCTALAFVVFANLVGAIGPGRASVITYVNPVVALGVGVVVLGERPGLGALAGLVLILLGSRLATRDPRPRP